MMKKLAKIALIGSLSCFIALPVLADLNDGLIGYWTFDETPNDVSGNRNNGIEKGGITYVPGKFAQAAKFDGVAAYIDVPDSNTLNNLQQFTISAWVYDIGDGDQVVLFKGRYNEEWHTDNQRQYQLYTTKTQAKFTVLTDDIAWQELTSSVDNTHVNQWRHVIATYDNKTMKVFVNGQLDNEQEIDTELFQPTHPKSLTIGAAFNINNNEHGNDVFYRNGLLDELRIYNRTLSECEAKSLYTGKDECVPPVACQLYGVHDGGLNNTQFFTISPETLEVKALGEMRKAHDIEALDIHPKTGKLFAASGKDTKTKGHLYQLNGQTGELTSIGSTGFKEIDGLSFHPDGTLWGWATGDGLVTIDTATGQASLVAAYSGEVEDLTWNTSGTMLFGIENMQDNPDAGVRLLAYDGNTVSTICEELTQSLEIEALDTLPDDTLLFGIHGKTSLPLGAIDVTNCQIVAETEIVTNYNDVEGIAWPNCQ